MKLKKESLYSMLQKTVGMRTDQQAVIWGDNDINYTEFMQIVNGIKKRIEKEDIDNAAIAIALKRTPLLLAAMFAVVASGNYYVPIDASYPTERMNYILKNSNVSAILLDIDTIVKADDIRMIYISMKEGEGVEETSEVILQNENPCGIAYCIYTSGSTGNPKGVLIREESLIDFICIFSQVIFAEQCKCMMCSTTHTFDMFFVESIFALISGMTVVLLGENERNNGRVLLSAIEKYNIDIIQMTPSKIRMLVNSGTELKELKKIKRLLIGGEGFPEEHLDFLKSISDARIYNLYGPTEATIWCSSCELTTKEYVTAGIPFSGVDFKIWDNVLQKISANEEGELLIGGKCLAESYQGMHQNERESFIYINNKRYFKTGDYVRQRDGEYQILGRIDNQIKYRGYRIELEEIEMTVRRDVRITQCMAYPVVKDNYVSRITLFYTSNGNEDCKENLQILLNQYLPEYMIPKEFIQVENFYYTNSGKIDRKCIHKLVPIKKNEIDEYSDNVQREIREMVWKITETQTYFNINTYMNDILDSLNFVRLIVLIENKYEVSLEDDILMKGLQVSFSDFVLLVKQEVMRSRGEKVHES